MRHKGNYERYIRDIYKKGAQQKKDRAEEAKELARVEAVSRLGHPPYTPEGLVALTCMAMCTPGRRRRHGPPTSRTSFVLLRLDLETKTDAPRPEQARRPLRKLHDRR